MNRLKDFLKCLILIGLYQLLCSCSFNEERAYQMPPIPDKDYRDPDKMIAFYAKVLEELGPRADLYYKRSKLFYEKEDMLNAAKDARLAYNLDTTVADYAFFRGVLYFERQDYFSAVKYAQKALNNGIRNPKVYEILGKSYFNLRQFQPAYEYLKLADQYLSQDVEVKYYLGFISLQNADTTNALSFLTACLTLDSIYEPAIHKKVLIANAQKQYQEAFEPWYRFISRDSISMAPLAFEGAQLYKTKRRLDSTVYYLQKALVLDSTFKEASVDLIATYIRRGMKVSAIQTAEKAMDDFPNQPEPIYQYGRIFEYLLDDLGSSLVTYQKAEGLDSLNQTYKQAIRRVKWKIKQNQAPVFKPITPLENIGIEKISIQ